MKQLIIKNKIIRVEAKAHLVFVNDKVKPVKIPQLIIDKFEPFFSKN